MSTLKADTIQSTGGGATTLTKQAAAKVFCNLDLKTENTIDASLNVSSITDRATGRVTATFTNAMSNINYTSLGNAWNGVSTNYARIVSPDEARTTSAVLVVTPLTSNFALEDCQDVDIVNHGDLA